MKREVRIAVRPSRRGHSAFLPATGFYHTTDLDNGQLGSSDIESIDISGQASKSLLGAIGTDQSVDLDAIDIVLLLEGSSDLTLVGLDVDDEDEGVVLFDLLHGGLGVEGVDEDLASIEAGLVRDGAARIFGGTAGGQSLASLSLF